MKKFYSAVVFFSFLLFSETEVFAQNIAINTTGAANPTAGSLLQIDNNPSSNILNTNSVTMSNVPFSINVPLSTNNYGTGLRFIVTGVSPSNGGGAIVFERIGGYSQGKLHFATKSTTTDDATIPVRMTIDQNGLIGIGNTSPASILDVTSTTSGFLAPRMTNADRTAIVAPATGSLIYQTDVGATAPTGIGFYYYPSGGPWTAFGGGGGGGWLLTGNSGLVDATNFLGTTAAAGDKPLNFRVNNQKAGRIDNTLENVFFGYQAGNSNGTGARNTAIGHQALFTNSSGIDNTAVGRGALYLSTGDYNTAAGYLALYNNTGLQNNAFGLQALYSNTTGGLNNAFGFYALFDNQGGSDNCAFGDGALMHNVSGNNNIGMGFQSGFNSTGSGNIFLGHAAGDNLTSGSNNVMLGYNIDAPVSTGSNQMSIGNLIYGTGVDGTGTAISSGNVGIRTNTPLARLHVYDAARGNVEVLTTGANPGHDFAYDGGADEKFYFTNIASATGETHFRWQNGATDNSLLCILNSGNIGIGDITPVAMFTVGNGDLFRVNSSGNLIRINNVPYSWPGAQGAASTFLQNDGAGNLSWAAGGGGGITMSCGTNNYLTKRASATDVSCSQVYDDGTDVGIGTTVPTNKFQIIGADNATTTGPIMSLAGTAANQVESGRIRLMEDNNVGVDGFLGGYMHYNGSTNMLHFGVHNTADQLTASDVNAISIARTPGANSTPRMGIANITPGTADATQFVGSETVLNLRAATVPPLFSAENNVANASIVDGATSAGFIAFAFPNQTASYRYIANITAYADGGTSGQRGGSISFQTRNNAVSGVTTERVQITQRGDMNAWHGITVDNLSTNNGAINNGANTGNALVFGQGSGEGIASKRTATGNQFGLDFYTGFANRMAITNGGYVGINTSSPQGLVDVNGGNTGLDALFVRTDPGANPWQGGIIHHQSNTYAFKETVQNTSSLTLATMQFDYVNRTAPTTVQRSNILVLESDGNVGIGTNAPASLVNMYGVAPTLTFTHATGVNQDNTGVIYFGEDATAGMKIRYDGANNKMAIVGRVGSVDGDLMTILRTGLAGIGRVPAANILEINGAGSQTTAGAWLANSDRRIKTDIRDIDSAITVIMKLRPVTFKYTEEWKKRNPFIQAHDHVYYNFIAQEYREIFPESVQGSGEYLAGDTAEILQIDTYNSQIVAIKAIQEQQKLIEELQRTRNVQQKLIDSQQSKIDGQLKISAEQQKKIDMLEKAVQELLKINSVGITAEKKK